MKNKVMLATLITLLVVGVGFYLFALAVMPESETELESETDVTKVEETDNMKQMVNDYSVGTLVAHNASITSHELIVTETEDAETQLVYALPDDEFFVSIAPYIENTHPCAIHSLTGCQGELVTEDFHVHIEDTDGNVILSDDIQSLPNGFIDLWVPRERHFIITISHDGKTAEGEFSSFEGDNTCITTIQL
ncbi:CueP family metal-binding protein [Alkalihalobacillus sp. LMS39]|uniref:CueP family metal-binding protein n=1 Tax=Alkalihalobacillus sp. LMS39 TaxID=2924032 RepID=UPI001FB53E1E|nr:CueP family metal-binding protein [Alkalihalobacillus sp. LMS39]UOE92738.1 CueP family metal-binding protein [Alkalihalobacillus sp. LMS39]